MPSYRSLRSGAASSASNTSRHLSSRLRSGAASSASNSSRHHPDDSLRQLCQEAADSRARVVAWLNSADFDAPPVEGGSTQTPPRAQAVSKKGPLERLTLEISMSEPGLGRSRSETPVRVKGHEELPDDAAPIRQRKMSPLHQHLEASRFPSPTRCRKEVKRPTSASPKVTNRFELAMWTSPAVERTFRLHGVRPTELAAKRITIDRVPSDDSSLSYASARAQTLVRLHANALVTAVQSIVVMIITAIADLCSLLGVAKSDSEGTRTDTSQSVQAHCGERERERERDASNPLGRDAVAALYEQRRARMLALNGGLSKPQIVESGRRVQSKRSMSSGRRQLSASH